MFHGRGVPSSPTPWGTFVHRLELSRDLLQGPMLYDDLRKIATHMEPRWRAGMYGTWAEDARGADPLSSGFEIPLHGLGLFACGREAWPTFNRMFRGFGGEHRRAADQDEGEK